MQTGPSPAPTALHLCLPCRCSPKGTYAEAGSSKCLPCPMHKYSSAAGSSSCASW